MSANQSLPELNPTKTEPSESDSKAEKKRSKSGKKSGQGKKPSSLDLTKVPDYALRDNSAEALKRLKVDLSKIGKLPPLNKILSETKGGISAAIEAMRFSDGILSHQFLDKWDSISEKDHGRVTIEVVALACGIDPRHLLGEIMLAMREYSVNKVKILALEAHPDVIKKRIEFAQLPGGYRDRDSLDTMLGALPRNSATFIDKIFVAGQPEDSDDEPEEVAPIEMVTDENFVFPDCEVMQERTKQKLLESKR